MTNDDRTNAIKSGEIDSVASELAKRHGVAQPVSQEQAPAGERRVTEPATALIGYLSSQGAAERITTLAQYGVIITPPAVAAAQPATGGTSGQDTNSARQTRKRLARRSAIWPISTGTRARFRDVSGTRERPHDSVAQHRDP